jgi:hypothetical protein
LVESLSAISASLGPSTCCKTTTSRWRLGKRASVDDRDPRHHGFVVIELGLLDSTEQREADRGVRRDSEGAVLRSANGERASDPRT